jgi:GNAT superfamily N-acetyltransferase
MTADTADLFAAVDATWPAARMFEESNWTFREGQGGGKRVSAATVIDPSQSMDIAFAEEKMAALEQEPLFMLRPEDEALDQELAALGYVVVDPVQLLVLPANRLTDVPIPRVTTFAIWEPLAIMAEIWAKGGIGPARLNVMARAETKTAILARWNEKPAGVGFVAAHGDIAMVHAVEVLKAQRGQGVAQWIMRQAAFWAQDNGASTLAVLCTKSNVAALALYSRLGFTPAGYYHYRKKP